jgi:hypothetical protein
VRQTVEDFASPLQVNSISAILHRGKWDLERRRLP